MTPVKAMESGRQHRQDLLCYGGRKDPVLGVRSASGPLFAIGLPPVTGQHIGILRFMFRRAQAALPGVHRRYGRLGHLVKVSLDERQGTPAAELWICGLAPMPLQDRPDLGDC